MASGKQQAASGKWQASLNFDIVKDDNGQRKVAPKKMTPNDSGRGRGKAKSRQEEGRNKRKEEEGKGKEEGVAEGAPGTGSSCG